MLYNTKFTIPTYAEVRLRIQADCENTIGLTSNNNRNIIINAIGNSYAGAVYGLHGNLEFLSINIGVGKISQDVLLKGS